MDKSGKKIIAFFIVLLLIILIILTILLVYAKKQPENYQGANRQEIGSSIIDYYGEPENNSISSSSYFDINTCMTQYLAILNTNNSIYYSYDENGRQTLIVEEKDIKQRIYNLLSQNYIEENKVTVDNIYEKIKTMKVQTMYVPLEAKVIQNGSITSFIVHGLAENLQLQVVDEIFAFINIDVINATFSVEPISGNYKSISEINNYKFDTTIVENSDNVFSRTPASYEETVKNYINLYKRLALGSPERLYNLLDKEYREARFKNLEEFKTYIQNNKQKIIGIRAEKYQATTNNDYTQYVCIDQNGNYYIFREKAVLDYTVILDTYTIDLPEFTEKYNNSSNEEKVLLNIQKFFEAINHSDYEYAYSKLDASYKSNNFKTLADFEKYVKENFFEQNKLSAKNAEKQEDIYLYTIMISDASGKDENSITKTFVMQLKEGTDFVMSFSIN